MHDSHRAVYTFTLAAEQVAFVLLRLPTVASDLVVQLNTPTYISAASAAAAHASVGSPATAVSAPSLLLRVLCTCSVRNWDLFGTQDAGGKTLMESGLNNM